MIMSRRNCAQVVSIKGGCLLPTCGETAGWGALFPDMDARAEEHNLSASSQEKEKQGKRRRNKKKEKKKPPKFRTSREGAGYCFNSVRL